MEQSHNAQEISKADMNPKYLKCAFPNAYIPYFQGFQYIHKFKMTPTIAANMLGGA
jgi:hypothetical protein